MQRVKRHCSASTLDELTAFANDLEAEGMTPFEALRYASTILK